MNILRFEIEKGPDSLKALNCYSKWNDIPEMPDILTIRWYYF